MLQSIRSFNLDKLIPTSPGLLFSSEDNTSVNFGESEAFRLSSNWAFETKFTVPSNITTGSIHLFDLQNSQLNRFEVVLESGLALKIKTGNFRNDLIVCSGLQANQETHVFLNTIAGQVSLYVSGVYQTTKGITNITQFWPYIGRPEAKTYTEDNDIYIKYIKLWNNATFENRIINANLYDLDILDYSNAKAIWNFEHVINNIVVDSSNWDNNGILDSSSNINKYLIKPAWKFNSSTNNYINNSTLKNYLSNKDYALSVEGWIYIDESSIASDPKIIEFVNNGNVDNPFLFSIDTNKNINIDIKDRAGNSFSISSTRTINLKKWCHVLFAFEGGSNSYSFSIDGNTEHGNFPSIPIGLNLSVLSGIKFADTQNNNIIFRNWKLYEVKLTDEQILDAYTYTTQYPVSREYVIADWKFQEESTQWCYDCSNHGNYLSVSKTDTAAIYLEDGGLYPEVWDGYDFASVGININTSHNNSSSDSNFIVDNNIVVESLFFTPYDETSYPLYNNYGSLIQVSGIVQNYIQYFDNSGDHIEFKSAKEIADDRTNSITAKDGKWHHIIAMWSRDLVISGTLFNTCIYHNGKLSNVATFPNYDISLNADGNLQIGNLLNGAVNIARLYNPTNSGMINWLNGNNVYLSPTFAITNCQPTGNPGLLFNGYFDRTTQTITNQSTQYQKTYELNAGVEITKIPLNYYGLSVSGKIPVKPTPKFAVGDIEHNNKYSLECIFRCNVLTYSGMTINVIKSDPLNFYITSGIYVANITPSVTISGFIETKIWHSILYRFDDNVYSFIIDGTEIISGISNDWYSPQENIKWGFYANNPLYYKYIDIKRIAIYDDWIAESDHLSKTEKLNLVGDFKFTNNTLTNI